MVGDAENFHNRIHFENSHFSFVISVDGAATQNAMCAMRAINMIPFGIELPSYFSLVRLRAQRRTDASNAGAATDQFHKLLSHNRRRDEMRFFF